MILNALLYQLSTLSGRISSSFLLMTGAARPLGHSYEKDEHRTSNVQRPTSNRVGLVQRSTFDVRCSMFIFIMPGERPAHDNSFRSSWTDPHDWHGLRSATTENAPRAATLGRSSTCRRAASLRRTLYTIEITHTSRHERRGRGHASAGYAHSETQRKRKGRGTPPDSNSDEKLGG